MQAILDHLDNVVRPAVRAYVAAEEGLDAAHTSKEQHLQACGAELADAAAYARYRKLLRQAAANG